MQLAPEFIRDSGFSKGETKMQVLNEYNPEQIRDSNETIFFADANSIQVFFDYYQAGKISDSIYKKILAEHNWDPKFFMGRKSDYRLMIKVIHTLNKLKIIPDLNNNNSFNDEHEYTIESKPGSYRIESLKFENIMYDSEEISKGVSYLFDLNIQIPASGEISCRLISKTYLTSTFKINNEDYKLFIEKIGFEPFFNQDKYVQFIIMPVSDKNPFPYADKSFHAKGDTTIVSDGALVLDSIALQGDIAYLRILDNYSMKTLLKEIAGSNGHPFSGKGIVIADVWATWCIPCLNQHKKYATLVKAYPNFRFIGILNDEAKNISKARKYLLDKKYKWDNYYFEDRSELKFWLKSMGSAVFPQYIIVDLDTGQIMGLYSNVDSLQLALESYENNYSTSVH